MLTNPATAGFFVEGHTMAQDDLHVVMYKMLSYLYSCLKKGENPSANVMAHTGGIVEIPFNYWVAVWEEMRDEGYVSGVSIIRAWSGDKIVDLEGARITASGVEYLSENSMMRKAAEFLKEAKSAIPFL